MRPDRLHSLYQFALAVADEASRGETLGKIHLLKYAYLADVEWARTHDGIIWTEVAWRFSDFGPYDEEALAEIEPAIRAAGGEIRRQESSKFAGDFYQYRLHKDNAPPRDAVPFALRQYLKHEVLHHLSDTSALLHYVYTTAPMVHAAPGETLDFSTACKVTGLMDTSATPIDVSPLTIRQRKQRQEKIAELRQKLTARLTAESTQVAPKSRLPRYDDVYQDGVAWLESLAGEAIPTGATNIQVDSGVWHSATREGGGVR